MEFRILAVALAYLVGTFPTGVLLARIRGVDLRAVGSGNIGATNVSRALGKRLGLVALLGDLGKGVAAIVLARLLADDTWWIAAAGLAAVLGHLFPVWLRFRGGKGVATAFGVIATLIPWAGLAGVACYVGVYAKTRVSSAGSLVGAAAATVVTPFVTGERAHWCLVGTLFAIIVIRHRANIGRLLRGTEGKV